MSNLPFAETDIVRNFDPLLLQRGNDYCQQQRVKSVTIEQEGWFIHGTVSGNHAKLYSVEVQIALVNSIIEINGQCSCSVQRNCKHVVALLLQVLKRDQTNTKHYELADWFERLDQALTVKPLQNEVLLYLLNRSLDSRSLHVTLAVVVQLKSGKYGKTTSFDEDMHEDLLAPIDRKIWDILQQSAQRHFDAQRLTFAITGEPASVLLEELISTERAHWVSKDSISLKKAEKRYADLSWQMNASGEQFLQARVAGTNALVLGLNPPWYIDVSQQQCGLLETGLPDRLASMLLSGPVIKPQQAKQIHDMLQQRLPANTIPLPTTFQGFEVREEQPQAHLRLYGRELKALDQLGMLPCAELIFSYGAFRARLKDPHEVFTELRQHTVIEIPRDRKFESACRLQLLQMGLLPILHSQDFMVGDIDNYNTQLSFLLEEVPRLQENGWEVIIEDTFPVQHIAEDVEWYSEIEETPGYQWFNLELGVIVEGVKLNILPLLINLIQSHVDKLDVEAINRLPDHQRLYGQLPDGRYLPIPVHRVRQLLMILVELYDQNALRDEKLALSYVRAMDLVALEQALQACQLRWFGGERLRKLAHRLAHFQGIQVAKVPSGFRAELRQYQQQGVNWLQFLREYDLAGILADDMGLGKTVQTLAHLLIEKTAGRMQLPTLVVAPTSLMANWRFEIHRFAPELTILTLHGAQRGRYFEEIEHYDIVLTTYPLIVRDKKILLEKEFYYLILDEAQIIKNTKTKAAQMLLQVNARHRLCLTGTPIENHLGELWSIFNFLLPGLLGQQKQFQRLFRTPIEKLNDKKRNEILVKRISPFLLRRTKEKVITELPAKNEIIRKVELQAAQRDLYESIRLAMQDKIRRVIAERGLARSRIIILDALLKLRQTCCDPRLLKLQSAKQIHDSAKLSLLFTLLPNLIEEGRKVLLFSSFTSMLELIEAELAKYRIRYVKLTGQTRDRETPIQQFQQGDVPLFLISLKAGGLGLNLTAADTVIHYDPWWNPAAEKQATDRAYRIGQDKPVFVYKLITEGTVEEKILSMQHKKQQLMENLFSQQSDNTVQLSQQDLEFLFEPLNDVTVSTD
ncbi:MAG: DEAD/DEAH box helicase [Gammaproteobacteria bacterium]